MNKIPSILKDKRPIKRLYTNSNDDIRCTAGEYGITKIVPYEENGWGTPVTWLAVYRGETISFRIIASAVEISYE